jgi:hypothetical protein
MAGCVERLPWAFEALVKRGGLVHCIWEGSRWVYRGFNALLGMFLRSPRRELLKLT